ncbi:MAG: filamentous hemagglutinin N-terminal domain-containing protein [Calothrix sp. SM1_7_51]|nr:filamentous hemagglutinin N-terminal domain-containing protein [Calothrix sp. SM1_7_51]
MANLGKINFYLHSLCIVSLAGSAIFCSGNYALAQITPDSTLGDNPSKITPDINIKGIPGERIDGGAVRGANLFHSFQEFNVGESQRVYFANPVGIQNILTRVTGSSTSKILGTLGVDGSANLFFLNPNGILFGDNARLDIAGSFLGSTANAIQFSERGFFSATNPENPSPLLTINPSGLFFNQLGLGKIENSSLAPAKDNLFGLRVPDGQSLLLIGGDITINRGGLNARGGRIELAGVLGAGTLDLNIDGNNFSLSFPENLAKADIFLTNASYVNTSGEGGGEIRVWGRQIKLSEGSQIAATTLGSKAGRGLTVNADELVELKGTTTDNRLSSGLFTQTAGTGDAGNLTINTKHLLVENGARVLTGTFSSGNGGSLTVNASESVQMTGATGITPFGSKFSSRMGSDTGSWFGSRLYRNPLVAQTALTGKGGNVTITTKELRLLNGAQIGVSIRGKGDGGDLTVNASESLQLIGFDPSDGTPSGLFSQTQGIGNSGSINISTKELTMENGGQVRGVTFAAGKTGNINISTERLFVRNANSGVKNDTWGTGNAGNINIETNTMGVINSQVGSIVGGKGKAGNLTIRAAESVDVSGKIVFAGIENPAGLFAQVNVTGEGSGGNLTVETQRLRVSNGGKVQVATFGQGDAGNLTIRAAEVEVFDTPTSNLFATGINAGIELDPDEIFAPPEGNGGDLIIGSPTR